MDDPRFGFLGTDIRGGLHGDPRWLRRAENVFFDDDRAAHMRPPLLYDGQLSSGSSNLGLYYLDGTWYTFVPESVSVTPTLTGVVVKTFHLPPDWGGVSFGDVELETATIFAGHLVALIWHRHHYDSDLWTLWLHVFDDKPDAPTYVWDPGARFDIIEPWPMVRERALDGQPWGTLGANRVGKGSWHPKMAVAGEKLWISLPNGDMRCCAIGNARVWADRTWEEIANDGEWFYACSSSEYGHLTEFDVGVFAAATNDIHGEWAAFICERWLESSGRWERMAWDPGSSPASNSYDFYFHARDWTDYARVVTVRANVAIDTLVRFRAIAAESPVQLLDGGQFFRHDEEFFLGGCDGRQTRWETEFRPEDLREGAFSLQIYELATPATRHFLGGYQAPGTAGAMWQVIERDVDGVLRGTISTVLWSEEQTGSGTSVLTDIEYDDTYALLPTAAGGDVVVSIDGQPASGWSASKDTGTGKTQITGLSFGTSQVVSVAYVPAADHGLLLKVWRDTVGGATIALNEEEQEVAPKLTDLADDWGSGTKVGYQWDQTSGPVITTDDHDPNDHALVRWVHVVEATEPLWVKISDVKPYRYPNDPLQLNQWYTDKSLRYVNELAGADQCTIKATSYYDPNGERISAMLAVKDKLVIGYPSSCQFWIIDPLPVQDRHLDMVHIGITGDLVPVNKMLMALTPKGFMALQPAGLNFDSLADTNLGEQLEGIGDLTFQAAAWWPYLGCYVCAASLTPSAIATRYGYTAGLHLFCLRISKESKVIAWSTWKLPEPASVTRLEAVGKNLYLVSELKRYRFDADEALFRDLGTTAYESRLRGPFDMLRRPGRRKKLRRIWVDQDGDCTVQLRLLPQERTRLESAVTVRGHAWGARKIRMAKLCFAAAVELVSDSEDGWACYGYQIEHQPSGR